jgi:hypothetical protein
VEIIVGDGGQPSTPTSMWGLTTGRRLSTLIICSFAPSRVTWCCGFLVRWALKSMYMPDLPSRENTLLIQWFKILESVFP